MFKLCNRPMNVNILMNQISGLTYKQLKINKNNMFNNHVPISLSYLPDSLPPIKDRSIKQSIVTEHVCNDTLLDLKTMNA